MAAKKGGLGKGLDSLIENKVNKTEAAEKPATASTTTTTKKNQIGSSQESILMRTDC